MKDIKSFGIQTIVGMYDINAASCFTGIGCYSIIIFIGFGMAIGSVIQIIRAVYLKI